MPHIEESRGEKVGVWGQGREAGIVWGALSVCTLMKKNLSRWRLVTRWNEFFRHTAFAGAARNVFHFFFFFFILCPTAAAATTLFFS